MGACGLLCKIPDDSSQHDLDTSLGAVLACHIKDAETLATCSARKAAVEGALRECAKR